MSVKLFKKDASKERKIAESYSVFNFLTVYDSENMSVAVGVAKEHNEITKTTSDRSYYILEGKIIINEEFIAQQGDVIYVSANTEYNFRGTFKAVIINSPPFKVNNENIIKLGNTA